MGTLRGVLPPKKEPLINKEGRANKRTGCAIIISVTADLTVAFKLT